MKNAHRHIRWLLPTLTFLLITSFSANADQKDEASQFLDNLHEFRINTFIALDAYYRFSAQGEPSIHYEITEAVNNANFAINSLALTKPNGADNQSLGNLKNEFKTFEELMRNNVNVVIQSGYSDLRLVSEMAENSDSLNSTADELQTTVSRLTDRGAQGKVEAARAAAVVMAQMMANYSVRSNLSASQTFQGSASDAPLDVKAGLFESYLATISTGDGLADINHSVEDIYTKWLFIRNSYINYNENNVSFIIGRYSRSIIDNLNTVIDKLQSNA